MSDFSLTLVMRLTTSKIINDMAKVQIKSEKITPFGGIFHVRELFSRFVAPIIDKVLGIRCTSYGYQYTSDTGKSYYLTLPLQNNCSLPVNLLIISDFSRQFHLYYFYFASTNPLLIIYLASTTPKTTDPPFVPKPGM